MSQQHSFQQRGMAIIAALIVVVAASALATSIIERQGLLADTLIFEGDRNQTAWMLRGGLDWARVVLQADANNSPTTRPDAMWARPIIGLPVGVADDPERALFSGQIEDEQAKYNLRNLADHAKINPQEVLVLERLLEWLRIDPSLALIIAQRMADAQTGKHAGPRAVGLRSIDELRVLDGITSQIIAALQPHITVLPAVTTINANTATAEVLAAVVDELGLAGARELIVQRDRGLWFANRADFLNRLRTPEPDVGRRISVSSSWFRVTGEVTIGDTMSGLRALLHRSDHGLPSVRWVNY